MSAISVDATGLGKSFGPRRVFSNLQFDLTPGDGLGITGPNGSGKSTLARIICGILSPTAGRVRILEDGREVDGLRRIDCVGFVSPYLQLYDEFSAWENLGFIRRVRGVALPDEDLGGLLDSVQLGARKSSRVRMFSDGMKQRLKYACALLHRPSVLVLDEPTSNLDASGTELVRRVMTDHLRRGILVVATNDPQDLLYCNRSVDLTMFADAAKR